MMNKLIHFSARPVENRIIVAVMAGCACVLLLAALFGCSSSTDPGPVEPDPPVTIEFTPPGHEQSLKISESMQFSALSTPTDGLEVIWYRAGVEVSQRTVFTYNPTVIGIDTLEVSAFVGAERDSHHWIIDVQEDVSLIPPEVSNINVVAGTDPAEVDVSWLWVTDTAFPLVEYLVAISYDGPVNEGNWDQATILDRYPVVPGQIGYLETITAAEHGIIPGARAWFAVRVRDDREQLSDLTTSFRHDISWPWYLGGYVFDDVGMPLSSVILDSSGPGHESNTDGINGYFLFDEPFRNIDGIQLTTTSPFWYDFVTDSVFVDQDTTLVDIFLLNKYELGYNCWNGEFLDYLRYMTGNERVIGLPDQSRLLKWDEYPVSFFIPPFQNSADVDMEAASLAAVAFWDSTMNSDAALLGIEETPYFVRTMDEVAADIVFLFELRPIEVGYGEVTLLLPTGPGSELGSVIPEKLQVWINATFALGTFDAVQGVALHELGHTLGLHKHSDCPGTEYLMRVAGGLGAMTKEDPIHLDERRAVRAIRNLPQGANLKDYRP